MMDKKYDIMYELLNDIHDDYLNEWSESTMGNEFTPDYDPLPMWDDNTKTISYSDRKNDGKLRLDLVPESAIISMAEVLTKGLDKYSENNWMKGHKFSTPLASLLRHLMAWKGGEDLDPETNLSHVKHILMNAAMLDYYIQKYPENDDRFKK